MPCTRRRKKAVTELKLSKQQLKIVILGFDYMDVVGRATQEAKAETQYPVRKSAFQAVQYIYQ